MYNIFEQVADEQPCTLSVELRNWMERTVQEALHFGLHISIQDQYEIMLNTVRRSPDHPNMLHEMETKRDEIVKYLAGLNGAM